MTVGHINKGYVSDEGINSKVVEPEYNPKKTTDTEVDNVNPILWTQIIGSIAGALGHMAIGVIYGFTGVTLPSLTNPDSTDIYLSTDQVSWFGGALNIGSIVASVFSGPMMVWAGQRVTMLVFYPLAIAGWITMSVTSEYWLLLLSRVVLGTTVGFCAGCCNNYIVEISHSNIRGRMMALTDLLRQGGFLFVYLVGSTSLGWRNVSLVCGIVSLAVPFVMLCFLPNSPRWLATQERKEEARESLLYFRGKDYNVDKEYNEIMADLKKTDASSGVFDQIKLLRDTSLILRLILLSFLLFATHFTGDFAMITYSVSIFESSKSGVNEYMSTLISAGSRVLGVIIYLIFADKVGRRPLLMIPLFLAGVCMSLLGVYFYLQIVLDDVSHISWLPLFSMVFFTLFTCMSHPVIMLLRSEALPTSVRAIGVGILQFMFFLGTFTVALTYPYMVRDIGSHWTFWVYGSTSFLMLAVIYFFIPETRGKSLEQIDDLFRGKKMDPVKA